MHLLQLPNELLQLIAGNLSTDADLNALIRTHSRFYHLLQTYLFEHNARYGESSALVWAAALGHIEIAKKLLQAKADVNTLGPLHRSLYKLNLRTSRRITVPCDFVWESCFPGDRRRSTPIMLAAMCGHKEIVELLVHHGADINREVSGCTPILGAIGHAHADIVEYLLIAGADLDVILRGDFSWHTPLEHAAHEGHVEVVKVLLRHGVDPNKSSPLALAAEMGRVEAARALLEGGANVEGRNTHNDMDALFNAVYRDEALIVGLLIEYGASLERRDDDDMTPLAFAAQVRSVKVAELLLDHGANVNALVHGSTALSFAIDEGNVPVVKLLLENGADLALTNEPFLLGVLKRCRNQEVDTAIVELLLSHKADPNCCDQKGRTPLILATVKHNLDIMRLLLAHGANPNREDEGIDLLSWAFLKGHADVANMLLAYGARESWLRGDHIMTLRGE